MGQAWPVQERRSAFDHRSLSVKQMRLLAVNALLNAARLDTPEKRLWFGVLSQIVADVGLRNPDGRPHHPSSNALEGFSNGTVEALADILDLNYHYILKVLQRACLLAVKSRNEHLFYFHNTPETAGKGENFLQTSASGRIRQVK